MCISKYNKLNRRFFSILTLALLLVGSVFAQKEVPPVGGKAKPFVFPKAEVYTLSNGLKVTLVQYGTVPKVAIQATIYGGTKDDAKDKKGASEIVGLMLKEGTLTSSGEQIARSTAEMGGGISVETGTDTTKVYGEVLSEFDARFIDLMADVILHPNFKTDALERLKANKLRNLAVSRSQADTQAWSKFRETIFPNHPYGQIDPTDAQVKSYTLEDIKKFYDENYQAAGTSLYVVGKFNSVAIKKAIARDFGGWKRGTLNARNIPVINAKRSLVTIDRPDSPQSTIYLGMPAPSRSDSDFTRFEVMNALLGGSFGSRITSNIRENKGYTYSPNSFTWNRYQTGYWMESADVTTQFTGASIKEILFEIARMRTETVSDAELQGIKNYLIGLYVLSNSSRVGVLGRLDDMDYNELSQSSIDNYVKGIDAVTAQDVQNVSKKYLLESKMTIVVVGDKSKIAEQLKPFEK